MAWRLSSYWMNNLHTIAEVTKMLDPIRSWKISREDQKERKGQKTQEIIQHSRTTLSSYLGGKLTCPQNEADFSLYRLPTDWKRPLLQYHLNILEVYSLTKIRTSKGKSPINKYLPTCLIYHFIVSRSHIDYNDADIQNTSRCVITWKSLLIADWSESKLTIALDHRFETALATFVVVQRVFGTLDMFYIIS